ncbi:MAG: hypothetical protein GY778_11700 [bacterium]|nr:hypothetical protein [bacterium]
MSTIYTVGGYWGPRQETAETCARRLGRILSELSKCDDVFSSWYEKAYSRAAALKTKVDWRQSDVLYELVRAGTSRTDFGQKVMRELGFHIGLWNGRPNSTAVGLSVTCGLYAKTAGLCNVAVFDLPESLGSFECAAKTKQVLLAVATAWEPQWAGVFSGEAKMSRQFNVSRPLVDWMLYLSHRPTSLGRFPDQVSVEETSDGGLITILSEAPPAIQDSDHLRKVEGVERALGIAG